jgi:hypothetical protein
VATRRQYEREASVSRFILRFATLFSTALIKQRNYFPEKRKTEKTRHSTFPKSVFFLTRLAETVQSERSEGTVDTNTAQIPSFVPTSRFVYSLGFEFSTSYKYKGTKQEKPDDLAAHKTGTGSPIPGTGSILYDQTTREMLDDGSKTATDSGWRSSPGILPSKYHTEHHPEYPSPLPNVNPHRPQLVLRDAIPGDPVRGAILCDAIRSCSVRDDMSVRFKRSIDSGA